MIIGFCIGIFAVFVIGLELYTGFAFVGWAGDNVVVGREKSPGPYWFTITLHLLLFVVLPLAIIVVEWTGG